MVAFLFSLILLMVSHAVKRQTRSSTLLASKMTVAPVDVDRPWTP